MKRLIFLSLFFFTSCAPVPRPTLVPPITTAVSAQPTFIFTLVTIESTATAIPPTPTSTPTLVPPTFTPVPCDPLAVDFCITEGHFLFQRPIRPPANTFVDITYRYASTANGTRDSHHGVEFLNKFGTPVYAAGSGKVIFAGPDTPARFSPWPNYYGNVVVIEHADQLYTLYAHLSKIGVETGQHVSTGEQIGEVGQTGVAIGSHLHFEVRRGRVEDYFSTQNPELWLAPNPDSNGQPLGVLQLAAQTKDGRLVKHAEFTLQRFDAQNQPADSIYYGVTYSADMLKDLENAAVGDLPSGRYRLVLQYNGQHMERWVEVESGKLTQVVFVVN